MHASMGDAVRFITLVVVLVFMMGNACHDVPIRSRLLITYLSIPVKTGTEMGRVFLSFSKLD